MSYRVRMERRATSLPLDDTVWVLASDSARAEVWPALGFNCYRWQVVHDGMAFELLYAAPNLFEEHAPTRSGFPILFPFPNRLRDGRFSWAGKDYQLPLNDPSGKNAIHGFACRRPWRVVDHGSDLSSAWLTGEFHCARDAPECLPLWPADHRLRVTYRLSDTGLRVDATADNPDRVPLPFGLGYHPYFRIPFGDAGSAEDTSLDVGANSWWELEEALPTGKRIPVEGARDLRLATPFPQLHADDVYTDLDERGLRPWDGLRDSGCLHGDKFGMQLLCSPDFRELVVFTPPHRQAVCLEPYTCVTDAINLQQRGIAAGLRVLQPGERWQGVVECHV